MADLNFEERCPCGNNVKISGYSTRDTMDQIRNWHRVHDKHANAIAKAMAAEKAQFPVYYLPSMNPAPLPGAAPYPWQNPIITFTTDTATGATTKNEG